MTATSERVRIMTDVSQAELEKIDELAACMKMSRSKFISSLISIALDDQEWLIKVVSSKFVVSVVSAIKAFGKKKECKL